jgi:hypothetical protein
MPAILNLSARNRRSAITKAQASTIYASEADLLNVALLGQTAKQWRDAHPDAEGNICDHAPLEQLVVLTNLESLNSVLIRRGLPQPERRPLPCRFYLLAVRWGEREGGCKL